MPVLSNPKHERFAQELAAGKNATVAAGFKPYRPGPSRLKHKSNIEQRVSELLQQREQIHGHATAEAIEKTALTKEWVIEKLIENATRALQAIPVLDRDGIPTGEYRYDGNVANRALELLGKELGMFVERSENIDKIYAISDEPPTPEEWEKQFCVTRN